MNEIATFQFMELLRPDYIMGTVFAIGILIVAFMFLSLFFMSLRRDGYYNDYLERRGKTISKRSEE